MTPSGQAEGPLPESGRAIDSIPKCRTASGRAMKHRGTMILPSERRAPAARREPRGGEIPMEPKAIGRLICPMPEVFWRMTSGESGIRGEIGL